MEAGGCRISKLLFRKTKGADEAGNPKTVQITTKIIQTRTGIREKYTKW